MTACIGLFHATQNAVGPVQDAWGESGTPATLRHYVDEGLLPLAARLGVADAAVRARLHHWLSLIAGDGADAVLTTCSSLTPAVVALRPTFGRPLVAIDEAMLEEAVARASRVGVVATLESAARTTRALLEATANSAGRLIGIRTVVAEGAFAALSRGDRAGHDLAVCDAAAHTAPDVDLIVFAQVSMSRVVVPPGRVPVPVLTSAPGAIRRTLAAIAEPTPSAR